MATDESLFPTRGRVLVMFLLIVFLGVTACLCFMYLQLLEIKQELNELRILRDLQDKSTQTNGHKIKRDHTDYRTQTDKTEKFRVNVDNPEKRQTSTTFMQELLMAQAHILESHCSNDSRLCMRGPKGEKGDPGVSNPINGAPTPPADPGNPTPPKVVPTTPPTPCVCLEEPKIAQLQNTVATSGENINIICLVTGNPTPYVTWQHNGVTFSKGPILHLTNVTQGMAGDYSCVARNLIGEQTKTTALKVLPNIIN